MGIEPNGTVRQAKMSGRSPAHSKSHTAPRTTSPGGFLEFRAGSGGGIAISGGGLCGVRFPTVWPRGRFPAWRWCEGRARLCR